MAAATLGVLMTLLGRSPAMAQDYRQGITPYMPITVPLAVRSPYLGAYLSGGRDKNLATMSPNFWTGSPLGWTGLIRVDGEVFNWMGNLTSWPAMHNASFLHTASSSTFTFVHASSDDSVPSAPSASPPIELTAYFISPVTPSDLLRQSLPFSYLHLSVRSLDGKDHQVQVYTDVNGLWTADEEDELIEWESHEHRGDGKGWKGASMKLKDRRPFQESNDRILQGEVYYVARDDSTSEVDTTVSVGHDANLTRQLFASTGSLGNGAPNSTFRSIRTRRPDSAINNEPTFAIAHDFGTVFPHAPQADRSALLAIGHIRTPVVSYMSLDPTTSTAHNVSLRPLWQSRFASPVDLVTFFLSDFETSLSMTRGWEERLEEEAKKAHGEEYANVVAISTRQIFQALEVVWDEMPSSGGPSSYLQVSSPDDTSKPRDVKAMIMLKEISSNGNCQTLDVITPALPFWLYAEPGMLNMLLEPVLRYVGTGLYPPTPPPHDIGAHYPLATGRNDFLYSGLPLEESGNILTMLYASVKVPGGKGKEQIERYWLILEKWARWLEENTLYPGEQRSTDDFFAFEANQTSLVIKGVVGLGAMAEMAGVVGRQDRGTYYRDLAERFVDRFLSLGMSAHGTHLLGAYANQSSWVTEYNLYLDRLLGLNLFPESLYKLQDAFYLSKARPYGPALDSRMLDRSKTDWLLWAAGASSPGPARDMFVSSVARYFRQSGNNVFGDLITPEDGWSVGFLTRPVVGGHFSLLALDLMRRRRPLLVETLAGFRDRLRQYSSDLGVGALVLLVAVGAVFVCANRSRASKGIDYAPVAVDSEQPSPQTDDDEGLRSTSPLDAESFELVSNPSRLDLLEKENEEGKTSYHD